MLHTWLPLFLRKERCPFNPRFSSSAVAKAPHKLDAWGDGDEPGVRRVSERNLYPSLSLFPGLRAFIIRAWRMGIGDYTPRWWISYGRGSAKRKWICLLRARLRTARSSFSLSPPSHLGLDALAHRWPRTYMFFRLSGCSQMFYFVENSVLLKCRNSEEKTRRLRIRS